MTEACRYARVDIQAIGKKAFVAQVLGRLLADTKVMGSIPGDHRNFKKGSNPEPLDVLPQRKDILKAIF